MALKTWSLGGPSESRSFSSRDPNCARRWWKSAFAPRPRPHNWGATANSWSRLSPSLQATFVAIRKARYDWLKIPTRVKGILATSDGTGSRVSAQVSPGTEARVISSFFSAGRLAEPTRRERKRALPGFQQRCECDYRGPFARPRHRRYPLVFGRQAGGIRILKESLLWLSWGQYSHLTGNWSSPGRVFRDVQLFS